MRMHSFTDQELMKAYQAGNYSAFEVLYQRHSGKVYGFLRKRLQRDELVDDCFQTIFSKFHRLRDRYDPRYSVEQFLFVITKTTLIDSYRSNARETSIRNQLEYENSDLNLSHSADTSELDSASLPLDQLSPQQRQVIEWKVLDEVSYEEIAHRLKQSEVNVRQIFSRAIRKLRSVVKPKEEKA